MGSEVGINPDKNVSLFFCLGITKLWGFRPKITWHFQLHWFLSPETTCLVWSSAVFLNVLHVANYVVTAAVNVSNGIIIYNHDYSCIYILVCHETCVAASTSQ
jgi:hypothetical protein